MKNRRLSTSSRTRRGAKILMYSDATEIACTVRNLSDKGACLEITNPGRAIPQVFQLKLVGEPDLRPCKSIWQADKWIGVSFHSLRLVKTSHENETRAVQAKPVGKGQIGTAMDAPLIGSKTVAE
jgi:hypothetical protein